MTYTSEGCAAACRAQRAAYDTWQAAPPGDSFAAALAAYKQATQAAETYLAEWKASLAGQKRKES